MENLKQGIPKTSLPKLNFGYLQGHHPDMSCLVENNYDPTEIPTPPPTQPSTPSSTTLAPTPKVSDLIMKCLCVFFVEYCFPRK